VEETATGEEYRFIALGPSLRETEWRACLTAVVAFREPLDFVAASGSLPPGAPDDFYARIAEIARERSIPFALDASGRALRAALDHGVDFVKPSLIEMRELTGAPLADPTSCVAACKNLIEWGKAKAVALTLGSQGAIFVTPEGAWRAWPLPIQPVSTVGAGDSFLAAMVCALASGLSPGEALRQGVAGGSAALLAPGTQLCHLGDMRELLGHVVVDRAD
jgi:6-phosphofructokinase 2